jgi:rhamnose utilization protein RhaD (predicted bifunctional aldolase and dehydrogenase)
MSLQTLAEISCWYGANPDYVLAGGGNTSFKDGETLYVKGSGMSLAEAVPEAFVKMNRKALAAIWEKQYPPSGAERESAVLADMMAARRPGEEQKRPSVETLLHDILPFAFVVHTHPALVNGLTCSVQGEKAMEEIFGDEALWIPSTNPGYILSRTVKTAMDAYRAKHGKNAAIIFLQNHGVFAGADGAEGVKKIYDAIMEKIALRIRRRPDFSGESRETSGAEKERLCGVLAELAGGSAVFLRNNEIAAFVKDRAAFAPVASAFTPDHIVYAGSDPLFVETPLKEGADALREASHQEASHQEAAFQETALLDAWKNHIAKTGKNPKIAAVQGLGIFGVGATGKAAALALELFRDAVRVAVYAESFGGPRFMIREQIDFINNWEAERFRSGVSAKEKE